METKWVLFTIMCLGAVMMGSGFYLADRNIRKKNVSEKRFYLYTVLIWTGCVIFIGLALTLRILKSCSII